MCLVSFFSRSGDEGWVHHFSEMFDSYYWICGKTDDGYSCIDLRGIPVVDSNFRKFSQERCSTCLQRLIPPQLLSSLTFDPTPRTERSFDPIVQKEPLAGKTLLLDDDKKLEDLDKLVESCKGQDEPILEPSCDAYEIRDLIQEPDDKLSTCSNDKVSPQNLDAEENNTPFNQTESNEDQTNQIVDPKFEGDPAMTNNVLTSLSDKELLNEMKCNEVSSPPRQQMAKEAKISTSNESSFKWSYQNDVAKYCSSSSSTSDTLEEENLQTTNSPKGKSLDRQIIQLPKDSAEFGSTRRLEILPENMSSDNEDVSVVSSVRSNVDFFLNRRFSDRSVPRRRKSFRRRASEPLYGAVIPNGPEIIYNVVAKVVQIEPGIKISFFHLTTQKEVVIELNDEMVKVKNKFGGFVSEQIVASSWLCRHLQLEQPVSVNLMFDRNVWKVLRIDGEFRLRTAKFEKFAQVSKLETNPGTL